MFQSGIGFGKLESYTKLDKLGEVSYGDMNDYHYYYDDISDIITVIFDYSLLWIICCCY